MQNAKCKMQKPLFLPSAFCLLPFLFAASVQAQLQLAAIRGIVLDPSSLVIPGVAIELTDPLGSVITSAISDAAGRFAFDNVAPGRYLLRTAIAGFDSQTHSVHVTGALPMELTLRLSFRTITEVFVDEAMRPDVPSTRTSIAGTTLAHLPVRAVARGIQEAVATLPGWATEDNGLLHVRGTDDGFLYVVDGVPVYERIDQLSGLPPDLGTIESINVLTGYIPPEFGHKAGGVIELSSTSPRRAWTGVMHAQRASDDDTSGGVSIGGPLNRRLSLTIGAAAQRSARFLDPVHPDNLHNDGRLATGATQLTWARPDADLVRVAAAGGRSVFDVPNSAEQQEAAQDQRQEIAQADLAASWQRVWSGSMVSQIAGYVRHSSVQLHGSAQDTPLFAMADRALARAGILTGLSRRAGSHTLKAGFELQRVSLDEAFVFGVTDEELARESGFSDEALQFDADDPFEFAGRASGVLSSAYLQDDWTATDRLTVGAGFRFDESRLLLARRQWSPRAGVAYRVANQTVLRGSVSRFFQPPQLENLLLASSEQARALSPFAEDGEAGGADVEPERQWAFEAGVEHRVGTSVRVDAAVWHRAVREAADPNVFAGTTIIFPNAVAEGRARGFDIRVEVQRPRAWSGYANATIARVRQRGPVTGGLFLEDDVADVVGGGEFVPDHDQLLVASGGLTWHPLRSRASVSFTIRHETGTPIETDEDEVEELQSRPGADTVDFDRGRVAPRTVASIQGEMPVWQPSRRSVVLRAAAVNVFNARYAYNFGNPFSGTHFGAPRTLSLALRVAF
jgi:outer membrane receptor protein involved in Fe transport